MAVDTRSKRASVLGIGLAAALTLPLADGSVEQADRQHVAFAYPGIAAGAPTAVTADVIVLARGVIDTVNAIPNVGTVYA